MTDETTTTATTEPTTPAPAPTSAATEADGAEAPSTPESRKAARIEKAREIVERHQAADADGGAAPAAPETAEPAAAEAPDEGAPSGVRKWATRDPVTNKIISREEAERRGIEPQYLEVEPGAESAATPGVDGAPDATSAGNASGSLIVKGPSRDGDGFEEITLPEGMDDQTVQTLQRWAKDGIRKSELKAQMAALERDRGEVDQFRGLMTDAPDVILPRFLPPEHKAKVALALLQEEKVYAEVTQTLEDWDLDPSKRHAARADRLEAERDAERQQERRAALARHNADLGTAIENLIPEGTPEAAADLFYRDASRDIESEIRRTGKLVYPSDLPNLLARRLSEIRYGGSGQAGENPQSSPNGAAPPAGNGAGPARRTATGTADPSKLRRLTAAPQGAGAPAALGAPVPKDIKLGKEGTGAYLRKRFGLGRRGNS